MSVADLYADQSPHKDRCAFCKVITLVERDIEDGLNYCVDTETCLYRFRIAHRRWWSSIRSVKKSR
jgi:hypothetical protein